MLKLQHLTKRFGAAPLFTDLCMEVDAPVVLWAPSGWGKTTLLRTIARTLAERQRLVAVVDERGELFPPEQPLPPLERVGGVDKARAVQMALRTLAPQVILLDEPTSNLDSLNEGIILKSLKESAEEKTIVLVSHRVSTMNVANVVYEMENGRIS